MHHDRSAERGATVLMVLAVVALILIGALAAIHVAASVRGERVRTAWDETLGTRDEVLAANPTTEANAAALKLERVAARIGIELAPRNATGRPDADEGARERHRDVKQEIGDYVYRELERVEADVASPPGAVDAFLDEHTATIGELRRLLIDGETPAWETEFSKLSAAPIPNLLGNIVLAKLLTADAFARIADGRTDLAADDLHAVWRLSASLRETPVLINQLIGVSEAGYVAGGVRQLGVVGEGWIERLTEHDYRASMIGALRHDGWVVSRLTEHEVDGEEGWLAWIVDPIARYRLAGAANSYRRRIDALADLGELCGGAALDPEISRTLRRSPRPTLIDSLLDPDFTPNVDGMVYRVARLELALEQSRKLLRLERARAAGGGSWPARPDWIRRSDACPDDGWHYVADADGMRLALTRELVPWDGHKGPLLPTVTVR